MSSQKSANRVFATKHHPLSVRPPTCLSSTRGPYPASSVVHHSFTSRSSPGRVTRPSTETTGGSTSRRGERNALRLSNVDHHYPAKSEPISDVAVHDDGGNFGRFARTGIMDDYRERLPGLSGIPLSAWQKVLSAFSEDKTETQINRAVVQPSRGYQNKEGDPKGVEAAKNLLTRVFALWNRPPCPSSSPPCGRWRRCFC